MAWPLDNQTRLIYKRIGSIIKKWPFQIRSRALRTIHNKRLYQQVADQIATRNPDGARLAMHHHLDEVKAIFPQNRNPLMEVP